MKIETSTVTRLEITEVPKLDPIRVYFENYGPWKGRVTISCYDAAWVGYWGAMGCTVEEFFMRCDAGYLLGNLSSAVSLRRSKTNDTYLLRIIKAVQDALRELASEKEKAGEETRTQADDRLFSNP